MKGVSNLKHLSDNLSLMNESLSVSHPLFNPSRVHQPPDILYNDATLPYSMEYSMDYSMDYRMDYSMIYSMETCGMAVHATNMSGGAYGKFHVHNSFLEYLNKTDGFQSFFFKKKLVQEMHTAHYLEDEDTMMEDDPEGADASDIHDVSFESNDSTLVDVSQTKGIFIQLNCNHSVTESKDFLLQLNIDGHLHSSHQASIHF
jgi:hypothetical protein